MRIDNEAEQLSIYDLDLWCGRMFQEPSPAEPQKERISGSSSRRSSELKSVVFQSLDLTPGAGNLLGEFYWELISPWRGDASTLNTGVSPREEKESSLSQILQDDPPDKYYLTRKACLGILRRAFERGKELPRKLNRALEIQSGVAPPDGRSTPLEAYHINQRDEGIDLHGVSGALMATNNMQMQTFVTQPDDAEIEGFDGYNGDLTGSVAATLGVNCGMSTGRNGLIQPIAFAANQRDEVRDLHDVAGAFAQAILVLWLAFLNPWLGLAALVVVGIIWQLGRASLGSTLAHSDVRQEQSESLTRAVLDYVEGIGIAKTFNLLGERSAELTDNFARSRKVSIEFEESQAPWMRALYLVCGLGSVLIIPLSLWLYGRGQLSITFLLGVLLFVFDLFGPIKALYSQATRLTVMNACMDRIEAVLAQPELPDRGRETLPKAGSAPEVEFRNVTFAYGEKEVLHDVSFTLEKNRMLALVGPSGGGKSTVANLLSRFWDVKQGQILVRGRDIRDIPLSDLMDQISMVFQRVYLFQDTVYNNIAMGRTDATREEVYEAARKARCYDFIMELPDGFDTVIGEGGASLSGGERQRISIARCILKDAPIVILDEATASVDADNESYIQEAITQLCRGKTLLVIAHRLNTIRHADEILVIDQGRIVQAGDHDKLMAEEGIYRRFITARSNPTGWCR